MPTAAVEFFKDGKWHCAKRTDDNHFVWSGVGKIDFPLRTRLTSVAGETVGGDIPKLINDKDQDSGFQYKKFKEGKNERSFKVFRIPCFIVVQCTFGGILISVVPSASVSCFFPESE